MCLISFEFVKKKYINNSFQYKNYLDVKSPLQQFDYFRPYQKTWFSYKATQSSIPTNFKPIKSQKIIDESSNLPKISIANTIGTISNLDTDNGHIISSSSILSVA